MNLYSQIKLYIQLICKGTYLIEDIPCLNNKDVIILKIDRVMQRVCPVLTVHCFHDKFGLKEIAVI